MSLLPTLEMDTPTLRNFVVSWDILPCWFGGPITGLVYPHVSKCEILLVVAHMFCTSII